MVGSKGWGVVGVKGASWWSRVVEVKGWGDGRWWGQGVSELGSRDGRGLGRGAEGQRVGWWESRSGRGLGRIKGVVGVKGGVKGQGGRGLG